LLAGSVPRDSCVSFQSIVLASREKLRMSEADIFVMRRFVQDLYKGVLKRVADAEGAEVHFRQLGAKPTFEDAATMLANFIASPEAARLLAVYTRVDVPVDRFDNIISLGTHCLTSFTLKKFRLKKWSGPFDWIFSNVGMITHCIEDNFHTYLDRKYHQAVPKKARIHADANVCEHTYYLDNNGIRFVFNHRDASEDEQFRYYTRCVERFQCALNSQARNLLVCISNCITCDEFLRLNDAVRRYPSSTLLAVSAITSGWNEFGAKLVDARGENRLYELQMTGQLGVRRQRS
jgi:Putative papain-like cysteine peptidase (DUF1796)